MRKTLKHILAEYGAVALTVYLTIFALVFVGAYVAVAMGWRPESLSGKVGTWVIAYGIVKLTQPLRIGATLLLTPLVARVYERLRGPRTPRDAPGALPEEPR